MIGPLGLDIYATIFSLGMVLAACVEILRQCCQHRRIRKTEPTIGQILTAEYRVRWYDLVSVIYPALCKPPILASARLLHWCEHLIMASLVGCQLGTNIRLDHQAPAVWKSRVLLTALCIAVDGRRSVWEVTAVDGVGETIALGSLAFVRVNQRSYEVRRVWPKRRIQHSYARL